MNTCAPLLAVALMSVWQSQLHAQGLSIYGSVSQEAREITGRLPAVLYLCGHTKGKVKPPYQANAFR